VGVSNPIGPTLQVRFWSVDSFDSHLVEVVATRFLGAGWKHALWGKLTAIFVLTLKTEKKSCKQL
jgi:hypothetical protein